ncbi:MAG: hypothetical protein R3B83_03760 [Nitrospirales bacterium]|nr:hypothetical protein [Nitrospirales bacterium]
MFWQNPSNLTHATHISKPLLTIGMGSGRHLDRRSASSVLRCLMIWHAPHLDLEAFQPASQETTRPRGGPYQTGMKRAAALDTDVVADPNFPACRGGGQKENLHTGCLPH